MNRVKHVPFEGIKTGKDTMGFLTESTLIPRKASAISGTTDDGMAGIRAAMASAAARRPQTSGPTTRGILRVKGGESKAPGASNKGVAQRAAADDATRSAQDLSASGEHGAVAAIVSTSLSVKERVYDVLAGHATPHEVIAAAAELGVCAGRAGGAGAGATLPPSLRIQLQKAAAEAARTIGQPLQDALEAALAKLHGAAVPSSLRTGADYGAADDNRGSEDGDAADSGGVGDDVMVDFALKRARAAVSAGDDRPSIKRSRLTTATPAGTSEAEAVGRDPAGLSSLPHRFAEAEPVAGIVARSHGSAVGGAGAGSAARADTGRGSDVSSLDIASMAHQAGYEAWKASHGVASSSGRGSGGSSSGGGDAVVRREAILVADVSREEAQLQMQARSLLHAAIAAPTPSLSTYRALESTSTATDQTTASTGAADERRGGRESRWDG